MQLTTSLPKEVVETQLARILGSRQFCNAPRLTRFLTYVVAESLAGRKHRLKGYTIGIEVFDKEADFDPQTDTIVRVQARALRQKLDQYYRQDGRDDPIHITIPKGSYEPSFYVSWDGEKPNEPDSTPALPETKKPSIAVLPFEYIGPKTSLEFLSDGLTEGTISNLSRFRDLSVFSRATTEKAKQQHLSIGEMFDLFHPDFVLEGSYRIRDDLIETSIRLIDAAADEILLTDQIDMRMDARHIYEMQDEIVARIAARIAVEYGPIGHYAQQVERSKPAIKWETYAWISRYFQFGIQLDQVGRDEIEAGLKHAVRNDPTSAEAHAALAMIEIEYYRAMTADAGDLARLDLAMKHASLAVSHDPQNAMAHQSLALAYFHARRFVDFRACVRRALRLNPGHSDMLAMFGICLVRLADWDEAIPLIDRAIALNPLHPSWYHMPKAMFLMMTTGADEAITELEKCPMPGFFAFHYLLVWFHVEAGDLDAAKVEKMRLLKVAPETETFARRYINAICLCDEIANRAISAFRKVDLHIVE
ncbi:TolB amino-terminal domain-containing protein [Litoreibacter ascidiaceicola]|uniref:TolB amino-terminal domain-containing protein n=1 Tax=Litoreibacter ascidiaceicola TaxID=1486859 RepID=A0A1M5BNA8_9RHOB|nr:hypothetical protein [Litoreibacter ascidiaceicola]SHF43707.1 TolB amino-terminal domain-containing protein [Litoreibacter ascidiaceicola]